MTHSPDDNSRLRDILRLSSIDISDANILEYNHKMYIPSIDINTFKEEADIKSEDIIIDYIKESYGLNSLEVLNESVNDNDAKIVFEFTSLLEINANEIVSVADNGVGMRMLMDRLISMITKKKYDQVSSIDREIRRCDKLLKDIEKEKALSRKKQASYKFSAVFLKNIAIDLITSFGLAKIFSNISIFKAGSKLSKFGNLGAIQAISKVKTPLKIASSIFPAVENSRNLVYSFSDYDKLLDYYAQKIAFVKSNLEDEKKMLEMSM